MKIEIRLMQGEDLPQILEIEQSWDYLSKWGQEGYSAVLRNPRVYACFVAEDVEAAIRVENSLLRKENGVDVCRESHRSEPTPSPLPGRRIAPSHQPSRSQGIIFDAPEEPLVAGFAILALLIDRCELCNLVVRPAYLSKKVGFSLLQECFEVAQHCGIEQAFLEVRQSNRRAIEFYEGNGFQITSQRNNYYRNPPEHAWIMERRLEKKCS
jgi:ribosomal protein S18 acetylase RimI-like enzyme